MDNSLAVKERTPTNVNGSVRRPSPSPSHNSSMVTGSAGRPVSLMDNHGGGQAHIVRVVVNKDEKGYGMKVSGDNPVYVQSVKEGGAAEKAGLHAGDKIIKVNGVNVMSSTHTEVVDLIKSSSQVVLTVQQRTASHRNMGSPSLHTRPVTTHSTSRITGPQPVDHEKQYQLQLEREQHYRLMIEKEQRYVDLLRSQIALCPDEKKCSELAKTEKNLQTLQAMLQNHIRSQTEQSATSDTPPPLPLSPPPHLRSPNNNTFEVPPPLPRRNQKNSPSYANGKVVPLDVNSAFLNQEINCNQPQVCRERKPSKVTKSVSDPTSEVMVRNSLYEDAPPPLPPRLPLTGSSDTDAVNSLNKQMSYPLVATCATLVNNYSPNHTHHRTKSSPDSLSTLSPAEASKRLIASESMSDLSRQEGWDTTATPPGTPPPPYPSPLAVRRQYHSNRNSANTDDGDGPFEESAMETSSAEVSPLRGSAPSQLTSGRVVSNNSPIHAASPPVAQQPIISMEDDEISDQEMGQFEDHGPFKSLARLWESTPHLAVFTNYVLSNSDPNSLLFYLLTDLYKEGNAKEMRKWAFEIHSCFLVPGAPLRLSNVDENVAREIDNELMREYDREEILRKIFWKARNRAKEELQKQLVDFQQKRIAGLGTIYGPSDPVLIEIGHDKTKELKMYEGLFMDKLDPYLEEVERENCDPKLYYTAAALATVITRIFGVRPGGHASDRIPTFVTKEKSFRTKFIGGRYSRKLNIQGHQFLAQIYYTVVVCNNCHQIIYGIAPQGYQCSVCHINLHRLCVKLYDDFCPGPMNKKDRVLGKLIRIRHESNENRRKGSHAQMEKERKLTEDRDNGLDLNESGESKPGHPVTRTASDKRPDSVREEASKSQDSPDHSQDKNEDDASHNDSTTSLPATTGNKRKTASNINRSESVKEQSEKEKRKQRRNISDPLHNTTNDRIDLDSQDLDTNSNNSSNSSLCSNKSSESPSNNSTDAVPGSTSAHPTGSECDSDLEVEADFLPDWQCSVPPEELASLHPGEKKRQDVINELFHTERSHVKNLKVLDTVFMRPLVAKQCLKAEELNLVFPNLNELLDIHIKFNNAMKSKKKEGPIIKEVGDVLLNMFDGVMGEHFQRAAATFCERQQLALEFIKEKRRKDSRFETILSDCEKNNLCRRLNLQGIITTQMQRLSKYPLLLERLIDSVEKSLELDMDFWQPELSKLKQAHERSREILNHVNEAAKLAYNCARLEEIQKHLDTSSFERMELSSATEYRNFDLTKYKLIYEGDMILKRPNKGPLQVYILLLEEAVVLLQKEGDKFLLKFFQSGLPGQQPLVPIIRMNNLLFRANAASKSSLYIVNTSSNNIQMYDLQVRDYAERKVWFKHLSDATEAYKVKEGKNKNSDHTHDNEEETVQELPTTSREPTERAEAVGGTDTSLGEASSTATNGEINQRNEVPEEERTKTASSDNDGSAETIGGGVTHSKVTADDWPLIQPSEVQVAVPPVLTAESKLTPLEQIRRKDEEVRQALAAKEGLVADLLSIPREDFLHIADMASEAIHNDNSTERDSTEFVLAPMYQVNQLLEAVNESLNISDSDPVIATGGKTAACASNEIAKSDLVPSVPAHKIRDIVTTLSSQLTTLLSIVKQGDAEREMLRRELHRLREQCHENSLLHGHVVSEVDNSIESTQSGDLEKIEESPTES